jgi:predicted AAA+ superfamily ATPase
VVFSLYLRKTTAKMIIQRYLLTTIKNALKSGKVNVLIGARRTGKTFLLKQLMQELAIPHLWLNGEDINAQKVLAERSAANYRRLTSGVELLVIDEAQVLPEIGKVLKLMVDEIPTLKIIASGSSAFDLNAQIGEPLVGRAYWHELFPIAQTELKHHENLFQTIENLEERLIYGSYPELFQLETIVEKERYVNSLINSFLLKDILSFEGIRNAGKVRDLLQLIAFQLGKEVSYDELGRQLSMSKNTVEKYLDLLEKTFILKKVRGFSRNLRKEISKNSRWYFWDNGVRNALITDFKPLSLRQDVGELWENYLITERLKRLSYGEKNKEYYFWRTYDQQEIDWIEVRNGEIEAYEFKWQKNTSKIPEAFAKGYPEAKFQVISKANYLDFIE